MRILHAVVAAWLLAASPALAAGTYTGRIISPQVEVSTGTSGAVVYIIAIDTAAAQPRMNTGANSVISFSSSIIVEGDLIVHSAKAKAVYVPYGGIHVSNAANPTTAPGQMFSKNIKTSTLTFYGSAMLWQDEAGVVVSTFTRNSIDMAPGSNIRGKIQLRNSGSGAPAAEDCTAAAVGTFYERTDSPKLYYCRSDATWGVLTMTAVP